MADETDNHTIKLLQEMRSEMREMRAEAREMRAETREGLDDVNTRIDGLSHIVTLLAGNMGGHEQRIEDLEVALDDLVKT